jgi:hypothetical protein
MSRRSSLEVFRRINGNKPGVTPKGSTRVREAWRPGEPKLRDRRKQNGKTLLESRYAPDSLPSDFQLALQVTPSLVAEGFSAQEVAALHDMLSSRDTTTMSSIGFVGLTDEIAHVPEGEDGGEEKGKGKGKGGKGKGKGKGGGEPPALTFAQRARARRA